MHILNEYYSFIKKANNMKKMIIGIFCTVLLCFAIAKAIFEIPITPLARILSEHLGIHYARCHYYSGKHYIIKVKEVEEDFGLVSHKGDTISRDDHDLDTTGVCVFDSSFLRSCLDYLRLRKLSNRRAMLFYGAGYRLNDTLIVDNDYWVVDSFVKKSKY